MTFTDAAGGWHNPLVIPPVSFLSPVCFFFLGILHVVMFIPILCLYVLYVHMYFMFIRTCTFNMFIRTLCLYVLCTSYVLYLEWFSTCACYTEWTPTIYAVCHHHWPDPDSPS